MNAQTLATEGLNRAVDKANRDHPSWSDRCWNLFLSWLNKKPQGYTFQMEQFRNDLYKWNKIEKPNSDRAYGYIPRRAVDKGLIVSAGKAKTESASAHGANSELWRKV